MACVLNPIIHHIPMKHENSEGRHSHNNKTHLHQQISFIPFRDTCE